VAFTWRETGGPPVVEPTRRGFGSRLIERSIVSELRGRIEVDYRPEGLVCAFWVPMDHGRPPP
jgi:two-component sensor histidine kinase